MPEVLSDPLARSILHPYLIGIGRQKLKWRAPIIRGRCSNQDSVSNGAAYVAL
jgi:hypothetical protein